MTIGWCAGRGHKAGLSDLWGRGREERDWRETRDGGRSEDQLLGDGMTCGLNGSENLLPAIGIEFVPVELREQSSANFGGRCMRGKWCQE